MVRVSTFADPPTSQSGCRPTRRGQSSKLRAQLSTRADCVGNPSVLRTAPRGSCRRSTRWLIVLPIKSPRQPLVRRQRRQADPSRPMRPTLPGPPSPRPHLPPRVLRVHQRAVFRYHRRLAIPQVLVVEKCPKPLVWFEITTSAATHVGTARTFDPTTEAAGADSEYIASTFVAGSAYTARARYQPSCHWKSAAPPMPHPGWLTRTNERCVRCGWVMRRTGNRASRWPAFTLVGFAQNRCTIYERVRLLVDSMAASMKTAAQTRDSWVLEKGDRDPT